MQFVTLSDLVQLGILVCAIVSIVLKARSDSSNSKKK